MKCLLLPKLLFALKVVKSIIEVTQYLVCRDGGALSNRITKGFVCGSLNESLN